MASLAPLISSLKPQPINPSSHKLLGFNYLSTQLTLKLSPTHQPFYSTTRLSNNFTTKASDSGRRPVQTGDNSSEQYCNYTIKLKETGNSITKGVCILRPMYKNFHFGEHGYVSVQGCLTSEDTDLNVIGGYGIFEGVQGTVKLQKICEAPVKLSYTFYLEGNENLSDKLALMG